MDFLSLLYGGKAAPRPAVTRYAEQWLAVARLLEPGPGGRCSPPAGGGDARRGERAHHHGGWLRDVCAGLDGLATLVEREARTSSFLVPPCL
eukprot:gene1676-64979_t